MTAGGEEKVLSYLQRIAEALEAIVALARKEAENDCEHYYRFDTDADRYRCIHCGGLDG